MNAAVDKVIAALEAHVRDTQAAILALQLATAETPAPAAAAVVDDMPLCYVCQARLRRRVVTCPDCHRVVCAFHRAPWRANRCHACLKKMPDGRSAAQEKRWSKAPALTTDEAIRRGTHLHAIEADLEAGISPVSIAATYDVARDWVIALSKKPRLKTKGDQP